VFLARAVLPTEDDRLVYLRMLAEGSLNLP
jgi:hypothetical protein